MSSPAKFDALSNRLIRIAEHQTLWPFSENKTGSLLLQEFSVEWIVHFQATLETLIKAHGAIVEYSARPPKTEFDEQLISLACASIDNAARSLEADKLEQFLEISWSFVQSGAKLFPWTPLSTLAEMGDMILQILKTVRMGKSKLTALDTLLPLVETSMERMLLMALLVDSQVAAVTTTAVSQPATIDIEQLKNPIVARIAKHRSAIANATGYVAQRIVMAEEGSWPAGLRRAVSCQPPGAAMV